MEKNDYDHLVESLTSQIFELSNYDIKNSDEFFAVALVVRGFIKDQLELLDESINSNQQKMQRVFEVFISQLKEVNSSISAQIAREETAFINREKDLLQPFLDQTKNDLNLYIYNSLKETIKKIKTEGGLDLNTELKQSASELHTTIQHLQTKATQFENGVKKAKASLAFTSVLASIIGGVATVIGFTLLINSGALNLPIHLTIQRQANQYSINQ
ncbi:TPA: hypothetical protein MO340_004234 [Salmonella enterica subsp. salamae serovar 35:g,m,s,t:-]|nr:hypothetical protein [Salmonella enterica subsp. salamae serovar 35:g,m,s,t:-]HCA3549706.1 hypothetical protein [Salmonella enterica subsp. salamae serovar 35:g,m,s,t:-]